MSDSPIFGQKRQRLKQGLILRAYRHGRAGRSEIRAWKFGNPCLKFWPCFIIPATSELLWVM